MTSLTAIFGNTQSDDAEESEKLLELYWNRAELKKEFASLRDETFRLRDKIKEQDGSRARVQQKLEHLENLLLDPDWVHNVVVFYQLRALNVSCERKLARFAEQLKQQREKREHSKLLDEWNEKKRGAAQGIEQQLDETRNQVQHLEAALQAERQRYASMGAIGRFFRKRSVTRQLDEIVANIETCQQQESELMLKLEEIVNRDAPDTQGLSIPNKRSINFMILAFAQQMYLHYAEDNLADFAKEAGDKSVGAINYGSRADCDVLLDIVRKRAGSLQNVGEYADILQQRAKLLSERALYKDDDDAVPVPGTVATIYMIDDNGVIRERDKNLLGENYWDVANVMSR